MKAGEHYDFRATTEKLAQHIDDIVESGDTILQAAHVGGRDWVLLCRKGSLTPKVADLSAEELEDLIVRAINRTAKNTGPKRREPGVR